jgi:peroxiredoxin
VRQLAAYEARKADFDALDATIYAASVDTLEQAREVAAKGITFPIGYGVTMEESQTFGAWPATDQHGTSIQPSEFLLGRGGVVLGSMYASGQVGRMGADEALTFMTNRERRRREQEGA